VTGRLRILLRTDSAICVVGGAATVFAGAIADGLDLDRAAVVRSVGLFLVGYGIVLAVLTRATPRTVEVAGRLTALADASWVGGTVVLIGVGAFSFGGSVLMAMAAIPVAALGVSKVLALRSATSQHSSATSRRAISASCH
jgi:hypothetical protein